MRGPIAAFTAVLLAGGVGGCSAPTPPPVPAEEEPTIASRTWAFGNGTLHGLTAGPEDGLPVLLLHGGRFSSETWRETGTLELLAREGFRVVALDLPGFGRSDAVGSERGDFLAEAMGVLGLARPVVLTPSMSGSFAFPLLVNSPGAVAGFVAVAPVGIDEHEARLRQVDVPALLLWGENDAVIPVDLGRRLESALRGSRLRVLPGASHACYLDRPAEFHEALVGFLRKLEAGGAGSP